MRRRRRGKRRSRGSYRSCGSCRAKPSAACLGRQVDRIGRAAVSTTLVAAFADDEGRALALDAYNEAARSDGSEFAAEIRANLAIYDGLVGQCSNQLLASTEDASPERYAALSGLLADDRLIVDATEGACEAYFNVELSQAGLTGLKDCGGRTPLHDVVDLSYTLFAGDPMTPISDGVAEDSVTASLDVFPSSGLICPSLARQASVDRLTGWVGLLSRPR